MEDENNSIVLLHKKIGMNVKKMRENYNFSQLDLALAIGHKSSTIISQAELGKNKHFNIEQLFKISKALNCDICNFIKL